MKQKISNQELLFVSKLQPFERYQYFLKRVADFQTLYTLEDNYANLAIAEIEGNQIISLWPAPVFALACATEKWDNCLVREIFLADFELIYTPEIRKKNLLLNIFSVPDKTGFIIDIDEFFRDLSTELEKYE